MKYVCKNLSSLEKCLFTDKIDSFSSIESISALKNEKINFQIAYTVLHQELRDKVPLFFKFDSELEEFIKVYKVEHVACRFPIYRNTDKEDYMIESGQMVPDILEEYDKEDNVYFVPDTLQTLWVEVDLEKNDKFKGLHEIAYSFYNKEGDLVLDNSIKIEIIDKKLESQDLIFTQWFHGDCLASYYNIDFLSDQHFSIMKDFLKTAKEYGVNAILTPVLTPPLDTKIGGERPTMQLVKVEVTKGGYKYDYSLLDRWVDMCLEIGFEYFEISHFFTQWGAKHAPKVMALVDGKERRIFGWDTDATSKEYISFLRDFISNLLKYLKNKGIDKKCFFHISDEPKETTLDNYLAAKNSIIDLLEGYLVTDALSDIEFYEKKVVSNPIPATDKIHNFIDKEVKDLWAYYCGGQNRLVSNRFIAMPAYRNRIIGVQLYKYHIKGFLHWGYNFYYNQFSRKLLNPYMINDGDFFTPSGDAYSVYPGFDRKPLKSTRLLVFNEALTDMRAFKTLEKLSSYEEVMSLIEDELDKTNNFDEITFYQYPQNSSYLLNLRHKVNKAIKDKLEE